MNRKYRAMDQCEMRYDLDSTSIQHHWAQIQRTRDSETERTDPNHDDLGSKLVNFIFLKIKIKIIFQIG